MTQQFLHFQSSAGRRLMLVDEVVEVIPMVSIQREAEDALNEKFCGLLNFRGSIVPVFDFSPYQEGVCNNTSSFLVVAQSPNGKIAVVASEVDYLLDIRDENVNYVSSSADREFNVAKIEDEMVRIVNTGKFFE